MSVGATTRTQGTPHPASPSQAVTTKTKTTKIDDVSKFIQTKVAAPISIISCAAGALSFLLPNYFNNESDPVNWVSDKLSKAALIANGIYGGFEQLSHKNLLASIGYISDLTITAMAPNEDLYIWRGFGSALDQLPGFAEKITENGLYKEELEKKYNPGKNKDFNFVKYNGFIDSIEKLFWGVKTVVKHTGSDIKKAYNEGNYLKMLREPFKYSERNTLISSIGILSGTVSSLLLGFKKFGAVVRDIFGIHADFAIFHNGIKEHSGEKEKSNTGHLCYLTSGVSFLAGSVFDLIYRIKETPRMFSLALGIDRLGQFFMALAQAKDNKLARAES